MLPEDQIIQVRVLYAIRHCRLDPKAVPEKAKKRFGQVGPGTMRTNGRKS